MNRRTFTKSGAISIAVTTLAGPAFAADKNMIGSLSAAQFKKANADGAAQLDALKATTATLSEKDAKLMHMVAAGGMMQLMASQLAVEKAASDDVKAIAKAEVAEQTGLSAKLAEFATAKQAAMPKDPHKNTARVLDDLRSKSGAEFDKAYLEASGVAGHELLQKTMTQVQAQAVDPDLKALAMTTLPLIQTHLAVSRDEMKSMGWS